MEHLEAKLKNINAFIMNFVFLSTSASTVRNFNQAGTARAIFLREFFSL